MDARSFFREVLEEAKRLGLGFWERIALIFGAALVVVSFRTLGSALHGISFKVTVDPRDETKRQVSDGGQAGDVDLPPAQQGEVPDLGGNSGGAA